MQLLHAPDLSSFVHLGRRRRVCKAVVVDSFMLLFMLSVSLTPQQHASVSHKRICSDNCTCCHTEIEVEDQTCYLTQSQYTDTGPASPRADPISPGAWQGSHWSTDFEVTGTAPHGKIPTGKVGFELRSASLEADTLLLGQ